MPENNLIPVVSIYTRFKEVASNNKTRPVVYWKEGERWKSYNYQDFLKLVVGLASGLSAQGINQDDKVAILSENRFEWLAVDLAVNKIGAVSVPIHATASGSLIDFIIDNSSSRFLFVSPSLLAKHKDLLVGLQSKVKIVLFNRLNDGKEDGIINWNDLFDNKNVSSPVKYNKVASIIYTSGTTGQPKGVMLSNENFISNVEGANQRIKILNTDKFLSFLPLSHVLERSCGSYVPIFNGASIAYAESIKLLAKNLIEVKPTILICVPKIFENLHEKIMASIRSKNSLIKKLFFSSLKKDCHPFLKKIADLLIHHKIRQSLGGKLRFAISGGASIQENVIRFFERINIKIVEGYGLTETSPIICTNTLEDNKIGSVGKPIPCFEIKIASDKEVLVRGKSVMLGYWNEPQLTAEAFSEDWFMTGDLGFQDKEGFLTIIGRKKDIIVTSNGKNVAPEKLEGVINLSPYIFQSLVVGHKRQCLGALIVPDKEIIGEEKYADKKILQAIVEKEINAINEKLMSHEKIKKYFILNKPFTMEEEELTPTLKIRRKIIENKYSKEIEKMYQN